VRIISVAALGADWTVRAHGFENDMLFRSGARAEAAARRLGERLAASGEACEIQVHDRTGALVGRFLCAAPGPSRGALAQASPP